MVARELPTDLSVRTASEQLQAYGFQLILSVAAFLSPTEIRLPDHPGW